MGKRSDSRIQMFYSIILVDQVSIPREDMWEEEYSLTRIIDLLTSQEHEIYVGVTYFYCK